MKDKRFVVQEHRTGEACLAPTTHWDLMLEQDEVLTTFRLEEPPEQVLVHPVRAEKIFDHPLRFLSYEGPVQKGTGHVHIVERGDYSALEWRDDLLALRLEGTILHGAFALTRTGGTEWRFAHEGAGSDPDQLPR